jgi:putative FmdB family regulatory protein
MPFYEYQCKSCGHDLEAMQKITDRPLKKCPHCGKSQLQRLMSAPVFRLKGGGWYETDFKGDQDTKRNLADRPEADAKDTGETKEAVKDTAKEGEPAAGNAKDAKAADAPLTDTAKGKPADKPAAPQPKAGKKADSAAGKSTARGRTTARGKPAVRRPVKKQASRTKSRR